MHDFHQEVTFKQYFYLHQQFMLIACLIVRVFFFFVCLFVCLFCVWVCVCLDYSRTNEQIFIKKLWVGPDQRKKLLKERSGSYYGYKKS